MEDIPPKELNGYISEFITQLLTFFDGQFLTVFKEEAKEFNISVRSLNQSPTLTSPETEMKYTTKYKRLKVLDSDSV